MAYRTCSLFSHGRQATYGMVTCKHLNLLHLSCSGVVQLSSPCLQSTPILSSYNNACGSYHISQGALSAGLKFQVPAHHWRDNMRSPGLAQVESSSWASRRSSWVNVKSGVIRT